MGLIWGQDFKIIYFLCFLGLFKAFGFAFKIAFEDFKFIF